MQLSSTLNRAASKRLLLAGLAACVLIVGIIIYASLQFHITSTTPSIDNFPSNSPILFINFNKPLAKTTLTTTWNPGVSSTYSVTGQRLTINIQSVLKTNQQYTITIRGVRSQAGDTLGNITYTFTAKDISYNNLPKEVQAALFDQQDQNQLPSRNTITFSGTNGLVNQGISAYQIEALKQAVFLFGQSTKTTITTAVVNDNTITIPPYSSTNVPDYFTILFDITINNTRYHAAMLYSNITAMELKLSQGSTQVYDSESIDGSTL